MDKNNFKFDMKIPQEYLSEVNYEGTRLIKIEDENVKVLQEELNKYQQEANPFLDEMAKYTPEIDRVYMEVRELEAKKKELLDDLAPTKALYDEQLKQVEAIDEKASVIKNKIETIVLEEAAPQLGEFEIPLHTKVVDGQMFVEVRDELEEKIKQIRAMKLKKANA